MPNAQRAADPELALDAPCRAERRFQSLLQPCRFSPHAAGLANSDLAKLRSAGLAEQMPAVRDTVRSWSLGTDQPPNGQFHVVIATTMISIQTWGKRRAPAPMEKPRPIADLVIKRYKERYGK